MFSKILIANRGEIACRIIKTARRMGIATVAVYSAADADALHVRMADEAVAIGGAPSAESYLNIDAIVRACLETGAEAVHPGFGFLAENAGFADALAARDITFIGPSKHAIRAMGDKIESKRLATAAGVDVVPGHAEAVDDPEEAVAIATRIGLPVMLKATAGGGGKGMRVARDAAEVRDGLASARNEARSSFGDDRVFVEKYIEHPRHIEIQVLGDGKGNCIHLGERECSIQRRHQKVVEEAPSPFLDEATRAAMGAQAVALAEAVDYASAGTVEFIVDRDRNFYFLEMNTRLQVEHPVTEMTLGIDLVEEMIRIAAGEPLSLAQDDVRFQGWAIEARIYAEDPARGFIPSVGRLSRCRPPEENAHVRVDTGVVEGSEITMFYDPMIAKLVTHGVDRGQAIDRMSAALDAYRISGIRHNVDFLAAIMASERFREGRLSTGFIAESFGDAFAPAPPRGEARNALIAVAAIVGAGLEVRDRALGGSGLWPRPDGEERVVLLDRVATPVTVGLQGDGWLVAFDGVDMAVTGRWRPGDDLFEGTVAGRPVAVRVAATGNHMTLSHGGHVVAGRYLNARAAELAALMPEKAPPDLSNLVLSPMAGLVVAIHVAPGEEVKAGQPLAVIEAMKMENVLTAERDGEVAEVRVVAGESLAADDIILEFAVE